MPTGTACQLHGKSQPKKKYQLLIVGLHGFWYDVDVTSLCNEYIYYKYCYQL